MSPHEDSSPDVDPEALDLLVDGELPEAERRRLLAGLDRVPGGWRACALAFLEAQCWKAELRAVAREPSGTELAGQASVGSGPGQVPVSVSRREPWPRRLRRWGGTALAMAASFLLAFVAANSLRTPRGTPAAPGSGEVARTGDSGPEALVPAEPGQKAPLSLSPEGLSPPYRMVTVTLPGDQPGARRTIRLPAVEADRVGGSWFGPAAEGIPPEIQAALEHFGYRVQSYRRQLIPLPTDDGRQVVLPVDQVDLHYVGNPSYQ